MAAAARPRRRVGLGLRALRGVGVTGAAVADVTRIGGGNAVEQVRRGDVLAVVDAVDEARRIGERIAGAAGVVADVAHAGVDTPAAVESRQRGGGLGLELGVAI